MKDILCLPDRLRAVANLIPKCELLSDIGTDHAFIPIYVVKNNIANSAIAADIVDGPLKIASDNIKSYNVDGRILTVKSNGLSALPHSDVVVIAGMGGTLIGDILEEGRDKIRDNDTLILQPMTCAYELRKKLHKLEFIITDETIAKDSGKLYNIMVVKNGTQHFEDEIYYHIGECVIKKHDPFLKEFLQHKIGVLSKRIENMKNSKNTYKEINEYQLLINEFRKVGECIDNNR